MSTTTVAGHEEVGRHRRALRVRAGMHQDELASVAGVAASTVGNAEKGRPLGESAIRALASALGVSAADYLGPDVPAGEDA